ncbi:MAG TPA: cation-translocating P-type ATPase [Vicinamibacterales bacterium]|jgi:Cd2+/Zn2+-exporting ATPase
MIGRFSQLGVYRELLRSQDFLRVAIAGGLALASYLLPNGGGPLTSHVGAALALASVALNGAPIIWAALKGLFEKRVNVDELVALAIAGSLLRGEFLTAAVVSFVMVFGSLIEQATATAARKAVETLVRLAPENATVLRDGRRVEARVEDLAVGDCVLVRSGERVPVDGRVVNGMTWLDESSMTGEPMPVEKRAGDDVFAGTLNHQGVIEIVATKVGENTTLGRVIELVLQAEAQRPAAVRMIDRYARWFTPTILAAAVVAWVVTGQADRAIAVLIVGCPCALILAAPTAVVATIGRAARAGVLVKGGVHLESVGRATAILFDKTGTLTAGTPCVDEVETADGIDPSYVLQRAASVEQHSTHPLARAVLKAAGDARLDLSEAEHMVTEVGLGVRAMVEGRQVEVGSAHLGGGGSAVPASLRRHLDRVKDRGATPLVVFEDKRAVGILSVTDQVRPGAKETVARLRALGIRQVGIVSGDHARAARRIADAVGADDCWSDLSPEGKPDVVKDLQRQGLTVVFVGDGINDAPALATADVGVAMAAAGTDVALETSDIALMHDDVTRIPFLVQLSRRMLRIIKWNIAFGLTFNAVAVLASGGGYLTPIMGAIVHNIGSVLVVLSSATMAFVKER